RTGRKGWLRQLPTTRNVRLVPVVSTKGCQGHCPAERDRRRLRLTHRQSRVMISHGLRRLSPDQQAPSAMVEASKGREAHERQRNTQDATSTTASNRAVS